MSSIFLDVRAFEQLCSIREPHQLPIQPEVQCKQPTVEQQKYVFPFAIHALNAWIGCQLGQARRALRFQRDRMKNVHAANALPFQDWAQRAYHCFDFGQFRHQREKKCKSGTWLEPERMLRRFGLGGIAKWSENRLAFVPKRKLVGIMVASR